MKKEVTNTGPAPVPCGDDPNTKKGQRRSTRHPWKIYAGKRLVDLALILILFGALTALCWYTGIAEGPTIIIAIIGALATFVVISNYSQVADIKAEFREGLNGSNDRFTEELRKNKERFREDLGEVEKRLREETRRDLEGIQRELTQHASEIDRFNQRFIDLDRRDLYRRIEGALDSLSTLKTRGDVEQGGEILNRLHFAIRDLKRFGDMGGAFVFTSWDLMEEIKRLISLCEPGSRVYRFLKRELKEVEALDDFHEAKYYPPHDPSEYEDPHDPD